MRTEKGQKFPPKLKKRHFKLTEISFLFSHFVCIFHHLQRAQAVSVLGTWKSEDVDASIGLKIVSAYKMMACSWKFEIDLQFRIIFFV